MSFRWWRRWNKPKAGTPGETQRRTKRPLRLAVGLRLELLEDRTLPSLSFASAVNYGTATAPFGVAIGDFNRDGVPDLAVVNSSAGTVSVLLGNRDGTYQSQQTYAVGSNPTSI